MSTDKMMLLGYSHRNYKFNVIIAKIFFFSVYYVVKILKASVVTSTEKNKLH
jgi:ABC-type thiamin/hydroxymethylpyrimidine transport system permease subunit